MDLQLFVAVMKRYKKLVGGGAVLATVLAVLAYGTPTISHGMPTIKPKSSQIWQAQAELMVTQSNDPYPTSSKYGDNVGYLSSLSGIYAAVANGSAVENLTRKDAGVNGIVESSEVVDPSTGNPLPLIT